MIKAPFQVGDLVRSNELATWNYTGLAGKPGVDKDAVRRFTKGSWVLEVGAHRNTSRTSRVVSIRTSDEDEAYWKETRQRLMRHRSR